MSNNHNDDNNDGITTNNTCNTSENVTSNIEIMTAKD